MVALSPRTSPWWSMYVELPNLQLQKFHHKFRRRFRMPYEQFLKVLEDMKDEELFCRWSNACDAVGQQASPLELLLLGSLRYLGRGWTFDDLEESTAISEETHRQFFHVFITWGSTKLFDAFVRMPQTAASTYISIILVL